MGPKIHIDVHDNGVCLLKSGQSNPDNNHPLSSLTAWQVKYSYTFVNPTIQKRAE